MSIAVKSNRWWPTNQIPYKLDASIGAADEAIRAVGANEQTMKQKINVAIEDWEQKTQARFKLADANDAEYLLLKIDNTIDGSGSSNELGFKAGNSITIKLKDKDIGIGTIIHEIGHALGLQHEHKRPDRDEYVRVFPEKSDVGPGNFTKLEEDEIYIHGSYDYSSVMHYKEGDAIQLTDPTAVVGTSPRLLSEGDVKIARRILPSNVHIHEISKNGVVGNEITRYCWTKDWTSCEFFKTREAEYLFLLKEGDGEVHIQKMNSSGKVGARVFTDNWTSGWTNVAFFQSNSETFLFLLKEKTGDIHIHKMNNDGSVGNKVIDENWTSGWTTTKFFKTEEGVFLFILKERTGDVHIHKMNDGGTVGERVYDEKWTKGWTNAGFYSVQNDTFLFLLKKRTGEVHVHRMNTNGKVGVRIQTHFLTENFWDLSEIYSKNNQNSVFLLNRKTGKAHIHSLDREGIKQRVKVYNWSSGWTTFIASNSLNRTGIILILKENFLQVEDLALGGSRLF